MMIKEMTPGQVIKEIRINKGLTQSDVAKEVGASLASVCRWERGDRQITVKRFEEILDFLGAEYTVNY